MMRLTSWGSPARRYALAVASCAYALAAWFSLTGSAGSCDPSTEGVYSAAQAARGRQIYEAQCAECHGQSMEGTSGPPLVGENFLSNWSARPLASSRRQGSKDDAVQSTRDAVRGRSRPTSSAYILQAGTFPAGQAELSDAHVGADVASRARTAPRRAAAVCCRRVPFPRPRATLPN